MKLPKELKDKTVLAGNSKNRKCSVKGCNEIVIRSLSENTWEKYVENAGLKIEKNSFHKIYLCKAHYSQSSKFRKSQEKKFQKKGFLDNSNSIKRGNWEV